MMRELILIRHAKSSWKDASLDDHDRTLNKRGERDAPFMAAVLQKRKITPHLIVSSSAVRALSTAKIFAKQLGYKKDQIQQEHDLYLAELEELVEFVKLLPDEQTTVLLFGHNPGITRLSNYFSGKNIANVPTCGICSIHFSLSHWNEVDSANGQLDFFEYPKLYFKDAED